MEKCFGTLLEILSENGWVSTVTAEKATKEYKSFHNKDFLKKAKNLIESQRVDHFYATILSNCKNYQDLWFVTKKVLVLSHGNGQVESVFRLMRIC